MWTMAPSGNKSLTKYFTNEVFRTKIQTSRGALRRPFSEMVNVMNLKPFLPLLLAAAALTGCASTANDPARAHALAEVQQARADGSLPLTEEQFVFPHLAAAHKAP